jgi:potassium-transporting ATPase potassium-binding subunit
MTSNGILQIGINILALFLLAPMLGSYMAKVFVGDKNFLSPILSPCERAIYRCCLIHPSEEMNWKKYAQSLVFFTGLGFVFTFGLQITQIYLPLNPQQLPNVPWPLAFNTAISFITNTNWQAYSGESTLSYLVQMLALTVQNFISAAMGIAVLLVLIRGITRNRTHDLGNFWIDLTRGILYVLLPLTIIGALFLLSQGVLQNLSPYVNAYTMEGLHQLLPMGPAASQIAIKQLGTNGGGFFGVNSAHPFENPTAFSNFLEVLAILLIPSALIYMFGLMIKSRRQAFMIYLVVTGIFFLCAGVMLWSEHLPNPALGVTQILEGKELRFGITNSTWWAAATTAASNGSVNAMHASLSALTGGVALFQILLGEIIFGGVGSGLYGMLLFVLLTVFLAGLMVGRTPEYMGKKLGAWEIKMILLAILGPSAVVLLGSGVTSVLPIILSSLGNQGPHGLSEILYAWGSTTNNNGSAFAGFNANSDLFNILLGVAMLIGRFLVIFPVIAIAGSLASKQAAPVSEAMFQSDNLTFAILLASVILIVGALTFVPVLVLGPVLEHFLVNTRQLF